MDKNKKIMAFGVFVIIGLSIIYGYFIYEKTDSIMTLTKETDSLQEELNQKNQALESLNNQLINTQNEKRIASENLNETIEELQLREIGKKYELHDPLFWEARNFLVLDHTNYNTYDEETFTCINYAQEVNNNAEKSGIRCGYVIVNFSDSEISHALIAFESTDQGLKFFEPQSDERVNLQIGKDYWADCVIPNGNYYYIDEPGDTIESYTIYW